jgi:NitT/TauT family transport system ATP-binding protein
MGSQSVIEARGLTFSYGNGAVLDGLSFSVERDEFVAFIGPSGCGKTTLLNILSGVADGHTGHLARRTRSLSFVFQHDTLLEWRDARRNVLLPFELEGMALTEELERRADHMLDLVGLSGYEAYYPRELSGGMKKRVEIARALVTEPELLFLDEPFTSLDIITRERLNILVKNIHQVQRSSVILVTHSVEEACFLSDRIYVMSNAPSRIMHVTGITDKADTRMDGFVLTEAEQHANHQTRERAVSFWAGDEPKVVPRPAMPAAPSHAGPARRPGPRPARALPHGARTGANLGGWLLFPAGIVFLFLALSVLKDTGHIPDFIFPRPARILARFGSTLADGSILPDLAITIAESLSGFAAAFALTMALGYAIAKSPVLSRLLMPYLVAANTIPSVALAPFLVLWFGFGLAPRIITSVIVIFFPMLINNVGAFRLAEEESRELARFYRPRPLRRFAKFELPAALPLISSAIKVSITLSVIGAVVGEFVAGSAGLGALVGRAKASFDVELMFVALLWLVILGLSYFGAAHLVFAAVQRRRHIAVGARASTNHTGKGYV